MILSLIGMSGIGKTYWSKKLKEQGFYHFCCDDIIEERLSEELMYEGFNGISDVARWMGQPYDLQYPKTSKKYLQIERAVMHELYDSLEQELKDKKNIVIDTTGSVIYTSEEIMNVLRHISKVIYLETSEEEKQAMFHTFMTDPKPIIWGDIFYQQPNEAPFEAIKRCYPQLLDYRATFYEKYAHVCIPFETIKHPKLTVEKFITLVS